MKRIELTQGQVAIVDDEDYEFLSVYKWQAKWVGETSSFVAVRSGTGSAKVCMHREIMKTPPELVTDHINHDTLDNRKDNLRNITAQQNQMNRRVGRSKTGYKGVRAISGKYYGVITLDNKRISLGGYDSILDAARAYDEKAKELFGQYACLNFPEDK